MEEKENDTFTCVMLLLINIEASKNIANIKDIEQMWNFGQLQEYS